VSRPNTKSAEKRAIRQAVADYMCSEGCSCCRDIDAHKKHKARLGKLLGVPMYSDKSSYDFPKFQTKPGLRGAPEP
jgi:hypothetical protein